MKRFCFMCGTEIDYDGSSRTHFCSPECYMNHTRELGRVKQQRLIESRRK